MAATSTSTVRSRRPIRGAIWGILLGLGLAAIFVGQKIVSLDSAMPWILLVIGIVAGILWGMVGPAKKPAGRPPREINRDGVEPEPSSEGSEDTAEGSEDTAEGSEDPAGGSRDPAPGDGDDAPRT